MFINVNSEPYRQFADLLLGESGVIDAAALAGISVKPFGNQQDFYVYALANPFTDQAFYIGKGKGKRGASHTAGARNALKGEIIANIVARGSKPTIHILADGLTEDDAYRLERLLIVRAHSALTNIAFGEKPEVDRIRAMARANLRQIKPLCQVLRERPEPFRLHAWQDIIATLARMSVAGTV